MIIIVILMEARNYNIERTYNNDNGVAKLKAENNALRQKLVESTSSETDCRGKIEW